MEATFLVRQNVTLPYSITETVLFQGLIRQKSRLGMEVAQTGTEFHLNIWVLLLILIFKRMGSNL